MTSNEDNGGAPQVICSDRTLAVLICAATVLAVALMAHHPTAHAQDAAGLVAELARKAALNRFVHGALIGLLALLLFAFTEFSARPGFSSPLARAARLAFATGAAASIVAALINGFVVTGLAARYAEADAAALDALRHLLRLCWQANQVFAALGEVARGLAVLVWSCALLQLGRSRLVGLTGLVLGGLPPALVLTGLLRLDLHGAMLALLATALWNLLLAVQLWRGRA
ncbi:MAG: hypothetical protein BGP24_13800 [Lysobacterales bacterium 69-70]|nr:hypothetical protein [Xanthomonadaceae bacterium]ODU35172.1 MAG: hypothetical protein ABS97_04635 [Xanthomonadaceae bacterium SCN 69-320]ODV16430.1 MAG: hypothetical protein ABT27_20200 [Xanthomonadaceae bacterium SCN 69-25]OJY94071.1 MAG: hypothetical protein BGP24_13800 [Xanthomonadales bacterium 69-70]